MHAMVYFTAKDMTDAARIAPPPARRRIACANIFPVRSLCRWRGKVEDETEAVAICKTRKAAVRRAIAEAKKVHRYEVPCIVSYEMGPALAAYGKWIDAETRPSKRRGSECGTELEGRSFE